MSEITRRRVITQLAASFAAAATVDYRFAREVHAQVQAAAGASSTKALSPLQFRTLERLTDLIIPVENDKPGAPFSTGMMRSVSRSSVRYSCAVSALGV